MLFALSLIVTTVLGYCINDNTITISTLNSCDEIKVDSNNNPLIERSGSNVLGGVTFNRLLIRSKSVPTTITIKDSSTSVPFILWYDSGNCLVDTIHFYMTGINNQWGLYNNMDSAKDQSYYFYPSEDNSDSKPYVFRPRVNAYFENKNDNYYITLGFDFSDHTVARIKGKFKVYIFSSTITSYRGYVMTTTDSNVLARPNYINQVMCVMKNGNIRFGFNDTEPIIEDCTCNKLSNGTWDKNDCEQYIEYLQFVAGCHYTTTKMGEKYGGLKLSGCGVDEVPSVTVDTATSLTLNDFKIDANGAIFNVKATLTMNIVIPENTPQIMINVDSGASVTINDVTLPEGVNMTNKILFVASDTTVSGTNVKAFCGGTYKRFATIDSSEDVICQCNFDSTKTGDEYVESDCVTDSAYRVLNLPLSRTIIASRTWMKIQSNEETTMTMSEGVTLTATNVFFSKNVNIDVPLSVSNSLTLGSTSGVSIFGDLTVTNTVTTGIQSGIVLIAKSASLSGLTKTCVNGVDGKSRFYIGLPVDPLCECKSLGSTDLLGYDQSDCEKSFASTSYDLIVPSVFATTKSAQWKTISSSEDYTITVGDGLTLTVLSFAPTHSTSIIGNLIVQNELTLNGDVNCLFSHIQYTNLVTTANINTLLFVGNAINPTGVTISCAALTGVTHKRYYTEGSTENCNCIPSTTTITSNTIYDVFDCQNYASERILSTSSNSLTVTSNLNFYGFENSNPITITSSGNAIEFSSTNVKNTITVNGTGSLKIGTINGVNGQALISTVPTTVTTNSAESGFVIVSPPSSQIGNLVSQCSITDSIGRYSTNTIGCDCTPNGNLETYVEGDCSVYSEYLNLKITGSSEFKDSRTWNTLKNEGTPFDITIISGKTLTVKTLTLDLDTTMSGSLNIQKLTLSNNAYVKFNLVPTIGQLVVSADFTNTIAFIAPTGISNTLGLFQVCTLGAMYRYSKTNTENCYCDPNIVSESIIGYVQKDCVEYSQYLTLQVPQSVTLTDKNWKTLNLPTNAITLTASGSVIVDKMSIPIESLFKTSGDGKLVINEVTLKLTLTNYIDLSALQITSVVFEDINYLFTTRQTNVITNTIHSCTLSDGYFRVTSTTSNIGCNCVFKSGSFEQTDCELFNSKSPAVYNLISSDYKSTTAAYYKTVSVESGSVLSTTGSSQINFDSCDFTAMTQVTLNTPTICTTMSVAKTTKILFFDILKITTLILPNEEHTNKGSVITTTTAANKLAIGSVTGTQCVDFASTSKGNEFSTSQIQTNMTLLSNNRLIRYCPTTSQYNTVKCKMNGNIYTSSVFDQIYCPCETSNCEIYPTTTFITLDVGMLNKVIIEKTSPTRNINGFSTLGTVQIEGTDGIYTFNGLAASKITLLEISGGQNTVTVGSYDTTVIATTMNTLQSETNKIKVYGSVGTLTVPKKNTISIFGSSTIQTATLGSIIGTTLQINNFEYKRNADDVYLLSGITWMSEIENNEGVSIEMSSIVEISKVKVAVSTFVMTFSVSNSVIGTIEGVADYKIVSTGDNIKVGLGNTSGSFEITKNIEFTSPIVNLKSLKMLSSTGFANISTTTTQLQVTRLESKNTQGVFGIDPSTTALNVVLNSGYDALITAPLILLYARSRKITGASLRCDNFVVLSGVYTDEKRTCKSLGLYERRCDYVNDIYVFEGSTDYSCPCTSIRSKCTISLTTTLSSFSFTSDFKPSILQLVSDVTLDSLSGVELQINTPFASLDVTGKNSVISLSSDTLASVSVHMETTESFVVFSKTRGLGNTLKTGVGQYSFSVGKNVDVCQMYVTLRDVTTCKNCLPNTGTVLKDGVCSDSNIENCQIAEATENSVICTLCDSGYYTTNQSTKCEKCNVENCEECMSGDGKCLKCKEGSYLSGDVCITVTPDTTNCLYFANTCRKCEGFLYPSTGSNMCSMCDTQCKTCEGTSDTCVVCNWEEGYSSSNDQCIKNSNASGVIGNTIVSCSVGYFFKNEMCVSCTETYGECRVCDSFKCLECKSGKIFNQDGKCVEDTNCDLIQNSRCTSCVNGTYIKEGTCSVCGTSCNKCYNKDTCLACNNDSHLTDSNTCSNEINNECLKDTIIGCLRCVDGTYLQNNKCEPCDSTCLTCSTTSTHCNSCKSNSHLVNGKCIENDEFLQKCDFYIDQLDGCLRCKIGYYKENRECLKCHDNCTSCTGYDVCQECISGYYYSLSTSLCLSQDELVYCETKSSSGCLKCANGVYTLNKECYKCSDNCKHCISVDTCGMCEEGYVLVEGQCQPMSNVVGCISTSNGLCSECKFNYKLKDNGSGCNFRINAVVIVIPILVFLIILIIVFVIIVIIVFKVTRYKADKKRQQSVTSFKMDNSSIIFTSLDKNLMVNKQVVDFVVEGKEAVEVCKETKDLVCVGNSGTKVVKAQFSLSSDSTDRYELKCEPELAFIRPGEAVEFTMTVNPYCSCKVDDTVKLVYCQMGKTKDFHFDIKIAFETEITTHLDYGEIELEKQVGEGAFGIVFKGVFRGNSVAVKQMKNFSCDDDSLDEFMKEVSMLDKFRENHIVHFYGAVLIPNKYCMVTEFAEFGSLQDCIHKIKEDKMPNEKLRVKFILDAAYGLEYLHSNGIIHRDIKPDNILVTSMNDGVDVNAKLTDFGSSRNINLLMTNITFTKGVGTPMYMAPEVMDQQKYKMPCDVFSLAVSFYEGYTWITPYPVSDFKFPWHIANFVIEGKRLPKPSSMPDWVYSIISQSWEQEPVDRLTIDNFVNKTKEGYSKF
ncbi:protein serine/threonine kinase, putative [Entamoeba invadens IP1]|uniref:Protein serine/threonine kinase, putative n=1 Tax=Entamoeba invadens IP1 TaxID=370355 RepID=A0A0A1UC53_ENTIV|nr:protein serine/threonine kinase, putative [Entamoeba invadens IP1]ELP91288.1 protein serine/threonine kinase, putative [Entamoeba invadens IP1]|eukprot:XP_004258059.1 protein serine/threonine kinase, putative [Entamoeba invadens IP1]